MAAGKTHEQINYAVLFLVFVPLLYSYFRDFFLLSVFGIFYIFGTLYLSPDLDMENTRPYKRWGKLSFIWYVYSKIIPHRSWLSHSFILGTLLRIIWLVGSIFLTGFFIVWLLNMISGGDATGAYLDSWKAIKIFCLTNKYFFHAALAGLFLSSILHQIVDLIWSFFKLG